MSSDVLAEAFVRLRALNDGSFEKDAHATIVPSLGRIAGDAGRVMAGVKLFGFAKEGIAELGDAEKAAAQTAAVIQSTGGVANVTAGHVDDLANSLLKLSGKDDEAIKGGENLLLTFKNIRNEAGAGNDIFDQTTKAALDLSVAFGQDMKSSALQLGKALDDPVRGLTALQRIGVRFSADQVDLIKNLVASGKQLEAQKVILKEVESQVGGSAKAYGETLPGQLERAQESMKNAKAAMVGSLAPALELGSSLTFKFAEGVQALPGPLQETLGVVVLLGGGIASLARPVSDIVNLYGKWKAASEASTAAKIAEAGAEAADAAAKTADIVAAEGLAVAETEVAVAAEAAAVAETEAGVAATGMLGPIGAAVAAIGLLAFGFTQAGKSSVSYASGADIGKRSTDDLVRGYRDLQHGTQDTGVSLDFFKHTAEENIGTAQRLRNAIHEQGGDTSKLDEILRSTADGQKQLNADQAAGIPGSDGLAASTKSLAQVMDEAKAAIDALNAAQIGMIDTTFGAFQSGLQLEQSQIRTRTALEEYTKATKDHTLSEDELTTKRDAAASAILSEAQAAAELAAKQAELNHHALDGSGKQAALVSELIKVRDTLKPGSELYNAVQAYIDKLAAIPTAIVTHVHIQADSEKGPAVTGQNIATKAGGGPVSAGQVFEGAEGDAWELLRYHGRYQARGDGDVLSHGQSLGTLAGLAGRGGGGTGDVTVHVTVNAPNYIGSHNDLVAALADPHGPVVEAVSEGLRRRDKGMR